MINDRTAFIWLACAGAALLAGFAVLAAISWRFGYAFDVPEMPILAMVSVLVATGLVFAVAAFVISRAGAGAVTAPSQKRLFILILLVGAAARLVLVASTPVLEDDYQRYLWDGAVTAAGYNPYAIVPGKAPASHDPAIRDLAESAGLTLERVNHPEIRTVYPPGAQAFFALAHLMQPFSRGAWRAVVITADAITFGLVLLLLHYAGRSLVWSGLYWWNPLVIKELTNSLHMEAVLMPFILGAVVFAVRKQPWLASLAIGLAGAIKIWPLALAPVLIRSASTRLPVYLGAALLIAGITALWVAPIVFAGLDQSAGLVAYAGKWRTNSGSFSLLLWFTETAGLPPLTGLTANVLARGIIAVIIVTAGFTMAVRRANTPLAVIQRTAVVAGIIFLVSPAQFPWYVVWIAPFLAFVPLPGLIALAATMPLYYVAFHLMSIDRFELFNGLVIWLVWCPVWALLIIQAALHGPMRRGQAAAVLTRRVS